MSKLGKRLIGAADEALAIARGEADPSTYRVHVPADIDVQMIRKSLKLSQGAFAAKFGIAPGTLRDWEQRRKRPDGPARVLLMVIDREPEAVSRALSRTEDEILKRDSVTTVSKMRSTRGAGAKPRQSAGRSRPRAGL